MNRPESNRPLSSEPESNRPESAHPAWAEIDLAALDRNCRSLAERLKPGTHVIASIKADAYGHGVVPVAERLAQNGLFALATGDFDEAVEVRKAGITSKILMFGGNLPDAMDELLEHDLIPTIYNMIAAEAVSKAARKPTAVYVKVDCGLGRLGILADDAVEFVLAVARLPNVVIEGVYTHVPFADRSGAAWSSGGIKRFDSIIASLAKRGLNVPVTQARASAGVLMGLEDASNAVCVGHILYGLSPMAAGEVPIAGFEPILQSVRSRLIHVGRHPAGRDIAIGGLYGLNAAKVTGVIAMGVTNGLRMPTKGQRAFVLLRGRRVPVISVSLEHTTLDMTGMEDAQVGEIVTAIGTDGGERIAVEEFAGWQERSPLEAIMTLSKRLPFRYGAHSGV